MDEETARMKFLPGLLDESWDADTEDAVAAELFAHPASINVLWEITPAEQRLAMLTRAFEVLRYRCTPQLWDVVRAVTFSHPDEGKDAKNYPALPEELGLYLRTSVDAAPLAALEAMESPGGRFFAAQLRHVGDRAAAYPEAAFRIVADDMNGHKRDELLEASCRTLLESGQPGPPGWEEIPTAYYVFKKAREAATTNTPDVPKFPVREENSGVLDIQQATAAVEARFTPPEAKLRSLIETSDSAGSWQLVKTLSSQGSAGLPVRLLEQLSWEGHSDEAAQILYQESRRRGGLPSRELLALVQRRAASAEDARTLLEGLCRIWAELDPASLRRDLDRIENPELRDFARRMLDLEKEAP